MIGFMKYQLNSHFRLSLVRRIFVGVVVGVTVCVTFVGQVIFAQTITDLSPTVDTVEKVPVREDVSRNTSVEPPLSGGNTPPSISSMNLDSQSLNSALFLLQIQNELKRAYKDYHDVSRVIDASRAKTQVTQDQLSTLRQQITAFQEQTDTTEAKVKAISSQIGIRDQEIASLQREVDARTEAFTTQKALMADYLRMQYISEDRFGGENGQSGDALDLRAVKLLLSDGNPADTLDSLRTLDLLQHQGHTLLTKLASSAAVIQRMQDDLIAKRHEFDVLQKDLLAQKDYLENQKLAKVELYRATNGDEQTYEKLIADSLKQQEETMLEVNSLQSNFSFIRNELQKKGSNISASDLQQILDQRTRDMYAYQQQQDSQSILSWPIVPSRGISAFFHDAAYKARFGVTHQAIDIPAPQNTPIHAPSDGYVYRTKDNGLGYSYVMLSHKNSMMTVYGHVTSILVKEGQFVRKGEVIGLSGGMPGTPGSGYLTTGSHVHLEVVINGEYKDPLDYLSLTALALENLPVKYADRIRDGMSTSSPVPNASGDKENIRNPSYAPGVEQQVLQNDAEESEAYKRIFGDMAKP